MLVCRKPDSSTRQVNFSIEDESSDDDVDGKEEGGEYEELTTVDPEDEKQMEKFMSDNPENRRTLYDIIQEKLTEKRTEIESQMSGWSLYSK